MTQRFLFVCSQNKLRSPTAEQIFSTYENMECDSAGLDSGATVELSTEQIVWADVIFVMESRHRNKLSKKFRSVLNGKRVIVLNIPDEYEFMDETLIKLLKARVVKFLR